MKGKNDSTPFFATEIKDRWKGDIHAKQRKFMFDRKTG